MSSSLLTRSRTFSDRACASAASSETLELARSARAWTTNSRACRCWRISAAPVGGVIGSYPRPVDIQERHDQARFFGIASDSASGLDVFGTHFGLPEDDHQPEAHDVESA